MPGIAAGRILLDVDVDELIRALRDLTQLAPSGRTLPELIGTASAEELIELTTEMRHEPRTNRQEPKVVFRPSARLREAIEYWKQ